MWNPFFTRIITLVFVNLDKAGTRFNMKKYSIFLFPLILVLACNGFRSVKAVFRDVPPYDRYVESLMKANLTRTMMTQEWISAGEDVFRDSVFIGIPFAESGFFEAANPQARSYRFEAKDGQVLTVKTTVKAPIDVSVFLDLFIRDDEGWEHTLYGDSTLSMTYEFSSNEECILRLQPELLVNVWYAINISLTPVLINPVYGASNKAIGSFYGASRDHGKRRHEGVDIFAPRGTPVVAPTHGYITKTSNSGLGGKAVWMRDLARGHSYYFAHLDSQMVKAGMHVRKGHVLGLVGNTGNARFTPSHLHFGIYQSGSKDPLYYIRQMDADMDAVPIDTGFHQKPFKTRTRKTNLMAGPSVKFPVKESLGPGTYVTVIGQCRNWYRISLPDETEGYLLKRHLAPLSTGTSVMLDTAVVLRSELHDDAVPVTELVKNTGVEILARFGHHQYIVTDQGKAGWLMARDHFQ